MEEIDDVETMMLMCVLLKRKKQKARPKGVEILNLKVRWRAKVAMRYCSEKSARYECVCFFYVCVHMFWRVDGERRRLE